MSVTVIGPRDKGTTPPKGIKIISTVSNSKSNPWSQLSPFRLGPCSLWGGHTSHTMENAWQYSKVYLTHDSGSGYPSIEWYKWADKGWSNPRAVRYPLGKGAMSEYSWWGERAYGYVEARAKIYVPLYARLVKRTDAFHKLRKMYRHGEDIWLWDYDGYDRSKLGFSLLDVLTCPTRKMGHAFVLAMMLEWGRDFYKP